MEIQQALLPAWSPHPAAFRERVQGMPQSQLVDIFLPNLHSGSVSEALLRRFQLQTGGKRLF